MDLERQIYLKTRKLKKLLNTQNIIKVLKD